MKYLKRKIFKYPFLLKEVILNYPNEKRNFRTRLGYKLNLKHPKSLNEKVVWKKIHDRNPLLPIVADKVKVREFVKAVLEENYHRILVPLHDVVEDPKLIRFDKLPAEYVVKANHGSGMNIIVSANDRVDREKIIKACESWLKEDYGLLNFEWAYTNIPRRILIEGLLRNKDGKLADDYKFHVINGKWEFVHVNHNKFVDHSPSLYDKKWNKFSVSYKGKIGSDIEKPRNLGEMVFIAERLGHYFDYVRVDLYLCDDEIYIGELTNYPASGSAKYTPAEFDYLMGGKWKIQPDYWKSNGSLALLECLVR